MSQAALAQTADDLGATVTAMAARLAQLDQELSPLRTEWIGSAQEAYVVARARWNAEIERLSGVLASARLSVMQSAAAYAEADRRGAAMFGR
ncbi:WXG100 family type VII secretion target [Nocardioides baekrokdamisoli]|uniref:WXG100 family type VII secretion target n=1 Tax=Nocardioides baekrokdamisoli TaxID=1804624 RepID=UPI0013DDD87D|nr:WXG100 family type VII secretion target [Nocardioides baekrokdamisoli]